MMERSRVRDRRRGWQVGHTESKDETHIDMTGKQQHQQQQQQLQIKNNKKKMPPAKICSVIMRHTTKRNELKLHVIKITFQCGRNNET